jgi:folate-binding Fe-S cluster repair protein YgfZ
MEHRGTARSRILPIAADRPLTKGSGITGRGRALGQLLSTAGTRALALIRLDRVAEAVDAGDPILAGDATVTVLKPAWARFKVPGAAAA